ncbi:MAG: hypothetical protein ACYDBV_02590 [Nitrospiria bacterium]
MNKRGLNPNSRANLKKTAGPGRPKMTLEDRAMKKYFSNYLESGEAVKDFERAREENPLKAVELAISTVYGKPRQSVEVSTSITLEQIRADFLGMIEEVKDDGPEEKEN